MTITEAEGHPQSDTAIPVITSPLHLDQATFRELLILQGPSLALWRAAEIAVLREQSFVAPILDFGCGDGIVTARVLSHVDIGLDPDETAVARARQEGIYAHFETVPMEHTSAADNSIGTVLSNSVIEHLPEPETALATVARILCPGGTFILTTPTDTFSHWLTLPLPGYAAWRNRHLAHLNLWPTERWIQELNRVGLEVQLVRPYMRHRLVWIWDVLELLQQIWLGRQRLFSLLWKRIPPAQMTCLSHSFSRLDLSSPAPGGGRLIVARKPLHK